MEQRATYVYLVLKRVAHAKRKEIFVYLVLKRVVRVETKATYYLHCSTCIPSGTECNVHFACSKIALPKWSGKQYTLTYKYARKRVACVEIHRLMYPYLVRKRVARVERIAICNISPAFESVFLKWNRKECNISLVWKYISLVMKRVYRVDQKAMYHCERSKSRNPNPTEGNIHFSFRCFSMLPKQDNSSIKRLPLSKTPTNDYSFDIIYLPRSKACFQSGTERNVTFPSTDKRTLSKAELSGQRILCIIPKLLAMDYTFNAFLSRQRIPHAIVVSNVEISASCLFTSHWVEQSTLLI